MKKTIMTLCLSLFLFTGGRADAAAWLSNTVLGKAQPDECYVTPGVNYPNGIAGYSSTAGPPCPGGSVPKTNQTYVWGMARSGNSLWFGTGPNVMCTTTAQYVGAGDLPMDSTSYVCEYGTSQLVREGVIADPKKGDVRPPRIFEYDLSTRTLIDRTPNEPLLKEIMGFRSAGAYNGVVFLAGGSISGPAVYMFAFDATTKQYLGSNVFPYGGTIRKWVVANGKLYTGMGIDGNPGKIYRWYGTNTDPWKFVVVGTVDGVPRELAEYKGTDGSTRIVTMSNGLWVSPPIDLPQGLPQSDAYWTPVWQPQNYEPDYMTARSYGGGSLYQFDGWLYWGTMHIPGRAEYLHENCAYPNVCFGTPQSPQEQSTLAAGTNRSTTIWRARNLEGGDPEVQLLYGESQLPKFNSVTRTFDMTPNAGGYVPLYGASGFGNTMNGYSWEMQTANGRLFIGTLDYTGADLWRFDSSNLPAVREDGAGLGDYRNYGIRTMEVSQDGNTLYCGMASYANLGNDAGWELHELVYPAPVNKVSAPLISPDSGKFTGSVSVTLTGPPGVSLYYTLDGSEPTQISKPYSSPIVLTQNATVKAKAFLGGWLPSDTTTAVYNSSLSFDFTLSTGGDKSVVRGLSVSNTITATIVAGNAKSVSFSVGGLPAGATASFSQGSCLPSCSTLLTITAPEITSAGIYPITVTGTGGTVVKTAGFTLTVANPSVKVPAPVFSPKAGMFTDSVPVSLSTSLSGAAIYYTLDGTDPTQNSTLFIAPIIVTKTTTIKAQAFAAGYLPSDIVTAKYSRSFDFSLSNGGDKALVSGNSVQNGIKSTVLGGATQAVTFSIAGLPGGATGTFSQLSCSPTCSTTLTIAAGSQTVPGFYPITVTGTAGTLTRTTGFTLTVSDLCAVTVATQVTSSSITLGRSIRDRVAVTNQGACLSAPTGTVSFQVSADNGSSWSNLGSIVALDSSGTTTSGTYVPPAAGNYYFRAIYGGDKNHQASQSNDTADMLTVVKAPTAAAITLSNSAVSLGGSVTSTITISTSAAGTLPPAGGTWNVQASRDSTFATEVQAVDSGQVNGALPFTIVTKPFTPKAAGTIYFRLTYGGDANYTAVRSGNAALTVQ